MGKLIVDNNQKPLFEVLLNRSKDTRDHKSLNFSHKPKYKYIMHQFKAFKYRIYPTKDQQSQLDQFLGAKRWVYNYFLSENNARYKNRTETNEKLPENKQLSHFDMNNKLVFLKEEFTWLKDMDSQALQAACGDLSNAYSNFFNSFKGKRKGKKSQTPRFKKKSSLQSYRTPNNNSCIYVKNNKLKLPKIKTHINIVLDRPIQGKIKSATITKTPSGKYFVSVLCETKVELKPMSGREVGIDLGLTDLMILSNGIKFGHPEKLLAKAKQQLKKQQKVLSRKKKGSKNRELVRIQVAKKFEKITSIRNDYYHNLSHYVVSNYDAIYMEDLNIAGMMKNRKLSRKIAESSWGILGSMIEYKATWYGKTFYKINRWTPSTKTCSCCGYKLESIGMGVREWTCPKCNTNHDRDINAALNIKNTGQLDLYNKKMSDVQSDLELKIPMALQKIANKTERSLKKSSKLVVGVSNRKDLIFA